MALKPPSIGDVVGQFSNLLGDNSLRTEVDRGLRSLAQSALTRMDVVSRDEFDTQAAILARTRERVSQLEQELETLVQLLEAKESEGQGD
jgi:BMFP domain-containing protein YqiC